MKLSLFTLSFYLFVSTAVAGVVGVAPRDPGSYDDCKSTVTKTKTKTLTETKIIKTIVKVYPHGKPTVSTQTITKTVAKATVTSTKPGKTVTVTKTEGNNGYPVPCYPNTITNTKTVTIPTTVEVGNGNCYPTTVTIPTTIEVPGYCIPTTIINTVDPKDPVTVTVPVTLPGESVTVTDTTTLTIPGEGELTTVYVPTTVELPGPTVTEPTTVTETTTEVSTLTEPTTTTQNLTITEVTTFTEPTTTTQNLTVTEVSTTTEVSTEVTTIFEPTTTTETATETEIKTVTVTAAPQTCNTQPIFNPGFEQKNPEIWYYIGSNVAANSGIQADEDSYEGKNNFLARGSSTNGGWSLDLHQSNIHVCQGTYIFTAFLKQDDTKNCFVEWLIDGVPLISGKPIKTWTSMSKKWTPTPGQNTVELKMKAKCEKGGHAAELRVDKVTLALQSN